MPNLYADLTTLKSSSFLNKSDTTDDAYLLGLLEAASRALDTWCKRHFYVYEGTRYFDGRGEILFLDDILSITTLKADSDQDGTFGDSYTASTDYELYPLNEYPKLRAEISSRSSRLYSDFNNGVKKGIQIVGVFGFGDGESATPYVDSTGVVNTGGIAIGATTHALATGKGALFAVGQTIRIGTEQLYISGISTDTLTFKRGVNGTTAAAHLAAVAIYIYQYPQLIKLACLIQTMRWWSRKDTAFQNSASIPELGQWISYKELDPDVRAIVAQFRNERFL